MFELAALLVVVLQGVIVIELAVLIRNVRLHTEEILRNMGVTRRKRDYQLWQEGFDEQQTTEAEK